MTAPEMLAHQKFDSTLVRARFGSGMLLEHGDLEQLSAFPRDLSRLLMRSLFGCGVVCGLEVDGDWKCGRLQVTVNPGVALDCEGDPIHVPRQVTLAVGDDCEGLTSPLWVLLCAALKTCAPRSSSCGCDDGEDIVRTRERWQFEVRVVRDRPECVCACNGPEAAPMSECRCADPTNSCYAKHYEGKCECECGACKSCDCKCVLLARLEKVGDDWKAIHGGVRRFVRPVLIRDPLLPLPQQAAPAPAPAEPEEPAPGGAETLEGTRSRRGSSGGRRQGS